MLKPTGIHRVYIRDDRSPNTAAPYTWEFAIGETAVFASSRSFETAEQARQDFADVAALPLDGADVVEVPR